MDLTGRRGPHRATADRSAPSLRESGHRSSSSSRQLRDRRKRPDGLAYRRLGRGSLRARPRRESPGLATRREATAHEDPGAALRCRATAPSSFNVTLPFRNTRYESRDKTNYRRDTMHQFVDTMHRFRNTRQRCCIGTFRDKAEEKAFRASAESFWEPLKRCASSRQRILAFRHRSLAVRSERCDPWDLSSALRDRCVA